MITHSAIALTGFITWALLLLVLMELIRTQLVLRGKIPANGFTPDNANLSPFMQRLARAHANCVESLPVLADCCWSRLSLSALTLQTRSLTSF